MKYIHVRNINKYHPGYKDRTNFWCKLHFSIVNGDPQFEMIENEIDKWRFIVIVICELQSREALPFEAKYFKRKGFDLKKRKLEATIKALSHFLEITENRSEINDEFLHKCVTQDSKVCNVEKSIVEKSREEKKREEKSLPTTLVDNSVDNFMGNVDKVADNTKSNKPSLSPDLKPSFSSFSTSKTVIKDLLPAEKKEITEILNYFSEKYKTQFGFYYPLNYEKESLIIKKLLKNQSPNILISCIDICFRVLKKDSWLKNKVTISVFAYKLSDFLSQI